MKKLKLLPALTLLPLTVLTVVSCKQPKDDNEYSTSDFDYVPSIAKHPSHQFETEQEAIIEYRNEILANPEIFIQDYLYDKAYSCKLKRDELYDEYEEENVDASFSAKVKDLSLRTPSDKDYGEHALVRLDGTLIVDSSITIRGPKHQNEDDVKIAETDISTLQISFTNMLFKFTMVDQKLDPHWQILFDPVTSDWRIEWSYLLKNILEEQSEDGAIAVITDEMYTADSATTAEKIGESEGLLRNIDFSSYHFSDVRTKPES